MLYILTLLSATASYYVARHSLSDIHLYTPTLSAREGMKGIFYLAFRFPRIYTVCCRVSEERYLCFRTILRVSYLYTNTVEGRNSFGV